MKIKELLDATKHAKGIETDGELARTLGVSKQAVSDYYNNKRAPDDYACLKIAEALGKPLDTVIATVKASSEKDDTRRVAWENYMKRLGGIAASVLVTLCVTVTLLVTPSPANASDTTFSARDVLHYVKSCSKKKKRINSDPHPWAAAN